MVDKPEALISSPGRLGHIDFPITASAVLSVIALAAICTFHLEPTWRDTLKFGVEAVTLAAGALSAYYVGQSLLQSVQQRDRSLRDAHTLAARRFMERWNDPNLAEIKDTFRQIIASGKAHDSGYIESELVAAEKRIVVVEVLNFFEEVALVANLGHADEETLKRYFRGALKSYYTTLSPWVQTHRASIARPTMWCEIEELLKRW